MNWKFIFLWKVINWYVLWIVKAESSIQVHDLVHNFWKRYHEVHVFSWWHIARKASTKRKKYCTPENLILSTLQLHSCGLVVFIDMSTYILTEDRNFKTFSQKNSSNHFGHLLAIYLLKSVKNEIENDVYSAYGVCIHYRHFWALNDI